MACEKLRQDVLDKRIVAINFSTWLLESSATIVAVLWTVPSGLIQSDTSFTSTVATSYFSGGVDGKDYNIKCTITTDEAIARKKTKEFILLIESDCN